MTMNSLGNQSGCPLTGLSTALAGVVNGHASGQIGAASVIFQNSIIIAYNPISNFPVSCRSFCCVPANLRVGQRAWPGEYPGFGIDLWRW